MRGYGADSNKSTIDIGLPDESKRLIGSNSVTINMN
jgi:hypothetical protein